MTSDILSNETCADCGHFESWHMFVKPPACDVDNCKCKKFIPQKFKSWLGKDISRPQNHSPQEKNNGKVLPYPLNTEDTEPSSNNEGGSDDASSLSDKIMYPFDIRKSRLLVKDVKESVQKLKDRFDWATLLHEEIDKIFGSALI